MLSFHWLGLPNGSPLGLLPRSQPPKHTLTISTPRLDDMNIDKGNGSCHFVKNTDYSAGSIWLHPRAATKVRHAPIHRNGLLKC